MKNPVMFTLADPDYYAPLEATEQRGRVFAPKTRPPGWTSATRDVWTLWTRAGLLLADAGWKVHVSARPERLDVVLETVAHICFERDVAFKHLSSMLFFNTAHAKHANRAQAGKFIAAYPDTVDASRELMECLAEALEDEEGPYVLSDRRFRDSKVVFYRYGAYRLFERVRPDGTRQALVPDADSRLVEDVRAVAFHLPPGISDPFFEAAPAAEPRHGGRSFHGFTFQKALQHSNSGGAYRAVEDATGRTVFVKEARTHNGFGPSGASSMDRLRAEWRTLRALHESAPGLAPEPIAYFRKWEHEFMVTEFVHGTKFGGWIAEHNPWADPSSSPEEFVDYGRRTERIIAQIERAFDRLHAAGYVFVDVSPNNVLIDAEDRARLIDFEAAGAIGEQFEVIATPGFSPPPDLAERGPTVYDSYGLAALALGTLLRFQSHAERNPAGLALLRGELEEAGPVSEPLWERVVSAYPLRPVAAETPPARSDPIARLARLRDKTASALTAMADADHPLRMYPTVAEGYAANTICVGYGTAGVIHALRKSDLDVPPEALERVRREAVDQAGSLGPGLMTGLAGIAWVLADSGLPEEAEYLLGLAIKHPITEQNATFAEGAAGVAMAAAALFGHTGDCRHLQSAVALAQRSLSGEGLGASLAANGAVGLFQGHTGVALMLQQIATLADDAVMLRGGLRLLHRDLRRIEDPDSARKVSYAFAGTAGLVHAASRYLTTAAAVDDERLAEAVPRLLRRLGRKYDVHAGLCQGLSGQAFALAEHARLTGDDSSRERALDVASGLVKYAVAHETGIRFPGDQNLRYSAELWSGSAGIVLALSQVLNPRPDPFFTLDAIACPAASC